jgi:hypothetical protein
MTDNATPARRRDYRTIRLGLGPLAARGALNAGGIQPRPASPSWAADAEFIVNFSWACYRLPYDAALGAPT